MAETLIVSRVAEGDDLTFMVAVVDDDAEGDADDDDGGANGRPCDAALGLGGKAVEPPPGPSLLGGRGGGYALI